MNAPFASRLLGWKSIKGVLVPNTADSANQASIDIAAGILDELQYHVITSGVANAKTGRPLEKPSRATLTKHSAQTLPRTAAVSSCMKSHD